MLQLDDHDVSTTALSRGRPLDDSDTASIIANTSKRQCLEQNTLKRGENGHCNIDVQSGMDVTMDVVVTSTTSRGNAVALTPTTITTTTLSPDDILVQMVQSGCYTQEDVVNFCISSGIPLSRMLRLDLIRLSQNNNNIQR